MNKQSGVYKITNTINGRFYIGSAANSFCKRFSEHRSTLKMGKHRNRLLQEDWNTFGERVFIFEILRVIDNKDEILEIEQELIDIYFDNGRYCYNLTPNAIPGGRRKGSPGRGMIRATFWITRKHKEMLEKSPLGQSEELRRAINTHFDI